jgi:hypothetical protein
MTEEKNNKGDDPTYHIKGGIHAGRDVIMGNQINYLAEKVEKVDSPAEFVQSLKEIQRTLAALKKQPDLTGAQTRNIEAAENKVQEAAEKADSDTPPIDEIQDDLKEAKETMDVLAGAITAAAALGTVLGSLGLMVARILGG